MYLSDINPELNSEINNIICESRQAKTPQERIDELMRAWDLIPKPATQFVTPTSGLCSEISGRFKELKDYSKALEWINIALEARKTVPDGSTFLWAGIIYYELGDMENAYKYFDLTYVLYLTAATPTTRSASQERCPTSTATSYGTANTPPGIVARVWYCGFKRSST